MATNERTAEDWLALRSEKEMTQMSVPNLGRVRRWRNGLFRSIQSQYPRPWVTAAGMWIFLPFGIYHMWRYRSWPLWLKWSSTISGPAFAAVSSYISSVYVWPHIF
jgi:hypothetical protein